MRYLHVRGGRNGRLKRRPHGRLQTMLADHHLAVVQSDLTVYMLIASDSGFSEQL